MLYYPDLTTRDAVERLLELTGSESSIATIRARIDESVHRVSREAAMVLRRTAMPYTASLVYDYTDAYDWRANRTIRFHRHLAVDDLLSVTTLTVADKVIEASEYVLRPANGWPAHQIRIKSGSVETLTYADNKEGAFVVAGEWGYVPHYPYHLANLTTLNGSIDDAVTTIAVADASSVETLSYLRIASETVQVIGVSANNLTVARGALGTTAAAHGNGLTVSRITVQPDIYLYVTERAVALYHLQYAGVEEAAIDPYLIAAFMTHKRYGIS